MAESDLSLMAALLSEPPETPPSSDHSQTERYEMNQGLATASGVEAEAGPVSAQPSVVKGRTI